jgi:flagellar biosynthesis/type III secretory pathway M-ring protein FliF/YscJ
MSTGWWVVIVAVLIVGAIIVYLRSRQAQVDRARESRMSVQELGRAQSPAEEISQREDRRLGGMSAEDRAWETASLERNRDMEERAQRAKATD